SAALKRNAQTAKGGPDGGNGGDGGNVYVEGKNDITLLSEFQFKKKVHGEDGVSGQKKNLFGRKGKDTIFFVPLGTTITNTQTHESFEVTKPGEKVLIAKGGKGGRGNNEFKSATNQTPRYAEPGEPGEEKELQLTLALIADVGFIGLPNAGKSSLLKELTNANPKIGNYPFTTLEPNLGVMKGMTLADIPGLIEGASAGKGLGIRFLKHIEKTKVLVHCIDVSDSDIVTTYQLVRNELEKYNSSLLTKQEIILLTKSDLVTPEDMQEKLRMLKQLAYVLPVSIYDQDSILHFQQTLQEVVERTLA
ncbi:MAG: GTPase ObgE, partial [Candidatus Levyibacteriota bacterium]